MSGNKNPLRVLITGCYAPPYGGVSVYVKRLFEYLVSQGHICHVYDRYNRVDADGPPGVYRLKGKSAMYIRMLTSAPYDVIHINENTWKHRGALILLAKLKGTRSIITLHSLREDVSKMSLANRLLMNWVLKHVDYLISSGENEVQRLKQSHPIEKIRVITPFMAPGADSKPWEPPLAIREFISRNGRIICANGSNVDFIQDKDIYGLDLLVELCHALRSSMDVGVLYCFSGPAGHAYLDTIKARIEAYGLSEHFLIFTEEIEFWKVIQICDIFIRPTRSDSFGISVAESLFLKKPTIASDVCNRPKGTVLFRNGDLNELVEKTAELLYMERVEIPCCPPDGAVMVESLYRELTDNKRHKLGISEGIR